MYKSVALNRAMTLTSSRQKMVRMDTLYAELMKIRQRLTEIERAMNEPKQQPIFIPDNRLLGLPDNLRKSYVIVASLENASADDVSVKTGRSRAAESSYLNQLVRLGWLEKTRERKAVHFRANPRMAMNHRSNAREVLSTPKQLEKTTPFSERRDGHPYSGPSHSTWT
jgi:hypothetical protein